MVVAVRSIEYLDAIGARSTLAKMRYGISANITIYVETTGDDNNSGSIDSPKQTLYGALVAASLLDTGAYWVKIKLGAGTFGNATAIYITPNVPTQAASALTIEGNDAVGGTILNCSADWVTLAAVGAGVTLKNLKVTNTFGGGGFGGLVTAYSGGNMAIDTGVQFGACEGVQLWATDTGQISTWGSDYVINGGGYHHLAASVGGVIAGNAAVTVVGTPAFSYFAAAGVCGNINNAGGSFTGAATGIRYDAQTNGGIQTGGGGANFYPGDAPGSYGTGGFYT